MQKEIAVLSRPVLRHTLADNIETILQHSVEYWTINNIGNAGTYNVILRRVRATIVVVEKQQMLYILGVYL